MKRDESSRLEIEGGPSASEADGPLPFTARIIRCIHPTSKVIQFVLVERFLGLLARGFDVALVVAAFSDPSLSGALWAFLIFTPAYFAFCSMIVIAVDLLLQAGIDITVLEESRRFRDAILGRRAYFLRACRWVLQQRRTIFWIGSWFYLDPDYVTLLLRDRTRGLLHAITTITIPSVILAMVVWVPVIWIAVNSVNAGFRWASWILDLD